MTFQYKLQKDRSVADTNKNRLLSTLSESELKKLDPRFIQASVGDELLKGDEQITHLFFPTTAVVAVYGTMEDGKTAGIGILGSEGAAGIVALSGASSTPYGKWVQTGGELICVSRVAMV